MALGGTYATGTVSVTNGSATVPGAAVLWVDVIEGDWLQVGASVAVIDSVNEAYNTITLKDGWAGATTLGAEYRILKMSWLRYDPALTQQKLREFIASIEEAGLFLFVAGNEPDPSLGENGQYALKTNNPNAPWLLWQKIDGTWVSQGSPAGMNWKRVWDEDYAYVINDAVTRAGRGYIAILQGTGHPPESSPTYWDVMSEGGSRYDVAAWASARPGSEETLLQMIMTATVTFYAGLTESQAHADEEATAQAIFSIRKNGVEFATITFALGATTGTFSCPSDTTFVPGDRFSIITPNPRDATLADISITVTGYR